jgi:hypothetical protein
VPYYPIIDLTSMEPQDSEGGAEAEVLVLGGEDKVVLPVFTSLDRFWAFVDKHYAGDDSVRPSTFPMDPFRLAEMVGAMQLAGGLDALVFNPFVVSAEEWSSAIKPIPIAHYSRFIAEIRPGIEQLAQEAEARFGHLPDSQSFNESIEWAKPRVHEVADNAGARMEEWQDSDDS